MAYEINMAVFVGKPLTLHRASGFRLPQQRNPQKAAWKTKTVWYSAKRFFAGWIGFQAA